MSNSRRKHATRAETIHTPRRGDLPRVLQEIRANPTPPAEGRPLTRGDCYTSPRPCPYVGCKYNLYLDVHPKSGAIKLNFPDLEPDGMIESCALDVADRDGQTLEQVGAAINMTRERIRQVEANTLAKLAKEWEE